jgi:hypothetical protein
MLISVIIPIHNRLDLAISAIGKRKDLRRDLVGHEDRSRSEDRAVIPGCGSMTWPFYSAPIEFDEAVKRGLRFCRRSGAFGSFGYGVSLRAGGHAMAEPARDDVDRPRNP